MDKTILVFDIRDPYMRVKFDTVKASLIDWGDGTFNRQPKHTYKETGLYTVTLHHNHMLRMTNGREPNYNLVKIIQIGNEIVDLTHAFTDCNALYSIDGLKIPKNVRHCHCMFAGCNSLTNIHNIVLHKNIKHCDYMFAFNNNLRTIDKIVIRGENIKNYLRMFAYNTNLTVGKIFSRNIELEKLFERCNLTIRKD